MSTEPIPAIEEQELRSLDGTVLWTRSVRPAGSARARLVFVHGFGEHGGRYLPTMRWFATHGCETHSFDLRGHGRSGGRRTFVRHWAEYLDDVEVFLLHIAAKGDAPLFLVGHSAGGLIVARTLQERRHRLPPLRGAVLTSPFLGMKTPLPGWKMSAVRLLSRWLPWSRLAANVDLARLSRDAEVGRAYLADPLVEKGATTRWFTEAKAAQEAAMTAGSKLDLPLLFMHGDDDGLADLEATCRLYAAAGSTDKELRLWSGARHELFNDLNKEEVWMHLLAWVEDRVPGPFLSGSHRDSVTPVVGEDLEGAAVT